MTEMTLRGDPIRIVVIFEPGKRVKPVWFELNHKMHKVVDIAYYWRDKFR